MTELLLSNVNYAQGPKNPPAAKKKSLAEIAKRLMDPSPLRLQRIVVVVFKSQSYGLNMDRSKWWSEGVDTCGSKVQWKRIFPVQHANESNWVKMKINILFVTPGEIIHGQRFCYVPFHDWVMARSTGSPTTSSSPSWGTHRGSRGLMGSVVPVACHQCFRISSQLDTSRIPPQGEFQEASCPNGRTGAAALWAPHPISTPQPSHPLEETYFSCLYSWSSRLHSL